MFPNPRVANSSITESSTDSDPFQNVGDHVRNYRKVFLANGEWAYYTVRSTVLKIPADSVATNWAFSSGFLEGAIPGASISTGRNSTNRFRCIYTLI